MAGIDFNKLDGGADISYPALRFSFPLLNENNHRAFWEQDIRVAPDGGGMSAASDGGACLSPNSACSQACDSDGGTSTQCIPATTCPGTGQTCTASGTAWCPGLACVDGPLAACSAGASCTCQPTLN